MRKGANRKALGFRWRNLLLMKDTEFDVTTIRLISVDEVAGRQQEFKASGKVVTFEGWTSLTSKDAFSEEEESSDELPQLQEGAER